MNYDSRFSYNLTIPDMEIRQITTKSDEMRHMKTSLNKSTLHCNSFNSLGRTATFEFSFFQHSVPILLAFFSAKSANPTVFSMRILLAHFSAKSANSTVFRIPILLVMKFFSAKPSVFRRLRRLQMPKRIRPNNKATFEKSSNHESLFSNNLQIYMLHFFCFDCKRSFSFHLANFKDLLTS